MDLFLKISSFLRVVLLLLGFFVFQSSIIISAAANPVIFSQGHHTVISETYTYNEIESSAHVEIDLTNRLSRVFLKKRVRPEHEVLADVARVAAKGGMQGFKSVGVAGKGFSKVLQSGGQSLKPNTLNALNLTKEQGRNAIHGLKKELGLPNNFHGKIMGNGDYLHPSTGKLLGNLLDYAY